MAFNTYTDLQTSIASWLARDDLTASIPDFITLFEAEASRRMKVRQQQVLTTLTPVSGAIALPTDYLSWIRLTWTGSPIIDLEYVHPSYIQQHYPDDPTANPSVWTIEAGIIKVMPVDSTPLAFLYNQKTPALSGTLNWLYTNHPDIYLAGAMFEAAKFTKDPDAIQLWKPQRDEIFDEIKMMNFREGGTLAIRNESITP